MTVHVDEAAALRGSAGSRAGLPIETVRRIACDSDSIVLVQDGHGNPLSVGRKTRVVPAAITAIAGSSVGRTGGAGLRLPAGGRDGRRRK